MKLYILGLYLTIMSTSLLGQTENSQLTVYSITEYSDGYVIKAIDALKGDTLTIISRKENPEHMEGYRKIEVGGRYTFKVENIAKRFAAMPPDNFVVRIKTTVVWKSGDRVKDMPVFSRNTKGVFIRIK